ncbi:MAG: RNA methyltransferase [Bacilli bacterium]|nr:RNA methyltransferase [Bacilli bacterium]
MIESINNIKIKDACKLHQKKYRTETNTFLVEGEHLVEEAVRTGYAIRIFSTQETDYPGVETWMVTKPVMKKLSELGEENGIIAVCQKPQSKPLSNSVLMLDHIQDPGNMGTLIRTAAAFGFHTILAENSVDFYNEKVIRSTQGTLFHVDLMEGYLVEFIKTHPGYHYYGTDVNNGTFLRDVVLFPKKVAIILGNEGSGMRAELKSLVNTNITIQMQSTESLNVAIAGGILMYESSRRK